MGSFNDWEDDQDSFYDWGSQFGKAKVETESYKHIDVAPKQEQKEEIQPKEPEKVETPEEAVAPAETTDAVATDVTEQPVPVRSRGKKKPLTREDLEKISSDQRCCEETTIQLRDRVQQLISLCSGSQLPKGMRSIIRCLGEVSDTSVATRALADFYLESVEEQRYTVFEESKLKSTAFHTVRTLQAQEPVIQEVLGELEDMIRKGEDRVTLNLWARVVKENLLKVRKKAKDQAIAYSKAIDGFHPEKGALAILERFAEKGDKVIVASIDGALDLAETAMVLVEDAPAMLVALDKNDTDTMMRLQKKLIDYHFDKK